MSTMNDLISKLMLFLSAFRQCLWAYQHIGGELLSSCTHATHEHTEILTHLCIRSIMSRVIGMRTLELVFSQMCSISMALVVA